MIRIVQNSCGVKNIWGFFLWFLLTPLDKFVVFCTFLTIYWKSIRLKEKAVYGYVPFVTLTVERNQRKIQIFAYFVKEWEKWTLFHKNKFLEDDEALSNEKDISWFFVKIYWILFDSFAHVFIRRFKLIKTCAFELICWNKKRNIFYVRKCVKEPLKQN